MRLQFDVLVPADLRTVFGFHESPSHLALLMSGRRAFRLLRHDGSIAPGSMTWIQETIGSVAPVTMGFRHTILEPPRRFAEEMVHGPFQRFVHVHEFAEMNGATRVTDIVEVTLPLYYGGKLATTRLVAPMIRRLFVDRHAVLVRTFARSVPMLEVRSTTVAET